MHTPNYDVIRQIQHLCPQQCSLAYCLTQLRHTQIQFLNLGNLIICPNHHCLIVFHMKKLLRIDHYTETAQSPFSDEQ